MKCSSCLRAHTNFEFALRSTQTSWRLRRTPSAAPSESLISTRRLSTLPRSFASLISRKGFRCRAVLCPPIHLPLPLPENRARVTSTRRRSIVCPLIVNTWDGGERASLPVGREGEVSIGYRTAIIFAGSGPVRRVSVYCPPSPPPVPPWSCPQSLLNSVRAASDLRVASPPCHAGTGFTEDYILFSNWGRSRIWNRDS